MNRKVLDMLAVELERQYPEKWSYAVDVYSVAIRKTIDNNKDALETIMNIRQSRGEECSIADLLKEIGDDWGNGQPASPGAGAMHAVGGEPFNR